MSRLTGKMTLLEHDVARVKQQKLFKFEAANGGLHNDVTEKAFHVFLSHEVKLKVN
jgi:hypothetical protein